MIDNMVGVGVGVQRKSMRPPPLGVSLAMVRLPEKAPDRCVTGS